MHGTGAPLGRASFETPPEATHAAREVARVLAAARTILIAGHEGADGDVVGSSLGLAAALGAAGVDKHVTVYNARPYPAVYQFIPSAAAVVHTLPADVAFDCTVVVDAARTDRLGAHFPSRERRGTFVWIDHHKIDPLPGDVNFVDLTAASVGEQIALVLDAMGIAITAASALPLYVSLLADTGGFRYANTSARALRLAARLVEAGVDPWMVTEHVYESQDHARLRMVGRMIERHWLSPCGRLAVATLTDADRKRIGFTDEHLQGSVNHLRGVKGVELACLLIEDEGGAARGGTRVIIRSRGNVSAAPLAIPFGAKGHRNAATFHVERTLADVRSTIVKHGLSAVGSVAPPPPDPFARARPLTP